MAGRSAITNRRRRRGRGELEAADLPPCGGDVRQDRGGRDGMRAFPAGHLLDVCGCRYNGCCSTVSLPAWPHSARRFFLRGRRGASGGPFRRSRAFGSSGWECGSGLLAAFLALARDTTCKPPQPARHVVAAGDRRGRRSRRCRPHHAERPAVPAVPAMGDPRGGTDAIAARPPHASGLRALARLSRRIAVRPRTYVSRA